MMGEGFFLFARHFQGLEIMEPCKPSVMCKAMRAESAEYSEVGSQFDACSIYVPENFFHLCGIHAESRLSTA